MILEQPEASRSLVQEVQSPRSERCGFGGSNLSRADRSCYRRMRLLVSAPEHRNQAMKILGRSIIPVFLAFAVECLGADWPHWRGPLDNRISPETNWLGAWPAEGPRQIWKTSLGFGLSS